MITLFNQIQSSSAQSNSSQFTYGLGSTPYNPYVAAPTVAMPYYPNAPLSSVMSVSPVDTGPTMGVQMPVAQPGSAQILYAHYGAQAVQGPTTTAGGTTAAAPAPAAPAAAPAATPAKPADAAKPAPAPKPDPTPEPTTVTVKSGDSLSKIAAAHGTTWQKLYELNKGVVGGNPNLIRPGQELKLP